jgi:NADPH-dependent curcumin reductase CurA
VRATTAGRVIESKPSSYKVGEHVLESGGVQSYLACGPVELQRCDVAYARLKEWLGVFGVSGLKAYLVLIEECKPQPATRTDSASK